MENKSFWLKQKSLVESKIAYAKEWSDGFDSEDEYDEYMLDLYEELENIEKHLGV